MTIEEAKEDWGQRPEEGERWRKEGVCVMWGKLGLSGMTARILATDCSWTFAQLPIDAEFLLDRLPTIARFLPGHQMTPDFYPATD
ncbi:hypothetical protein KFK09_024696 [Dendrobium nobile]|uniref:Uncharacterized protein n=1 Tax=Dendrobium nobile TaxID=94219 RepID=A0A8T3AEH9_DENNO|nr:hypothetical protein KFK09_024696 [Dendrobium nobile]